VLLLWAVVGEVCAFTVGRLGVESWLYLTIQAVKFVLVVVECCYVTNVRIWDWNGLLVGFVLLFGFSVGFAVAVKLRVFYGTESGGMLGSTVREAEVLDCVEKV
jgi:hypothetical protein